MMYSIIAGPAPPGAAPSLRTMPIGRPRAIIGPHRILSQSAMTHPFPAVPVLSKQVEDRRFFALITRLAPRGGMLSDVELRCMHNAIHSNTALGPALLRREVVAIAWRHRLWFPVFQFRLPNWEPSPCVGEVVADLFPVLQGFDLLEWFLTPNAWLKDRRPLELLGSEPAQVRRAAQAERLLMSF